MLKLLDKSNLKGGYKKSESQMLFDEALVALRKSSATAAEIIKFVENEPKISIGVACIEMDGAFGSSCLAIGEVSPVIVWNPKKKFQVSGWEITGYRKYNNSPIYGSKEIMTYPPELVLLHELGHAKQYIEHPDWFTKEKSGGDAIPGTKSTKDIESDNLERHERPVAKDLGLKVRQSYEDYLGFVD